VPGIYRTWKDCHAQVHRYSGNCYKKYNTEAKALTVYYGANIPNNNDQDLAIEIEEMPALQIEEMPARKMSFLGALLLFAPKIGTSCLTGQTYGSHRSDRCGQSSRNPIWTSPLDRSRRVDQDSYVERPNRSPDERDMTSPRSTRRVHRSDRFPSPVRPVPPDSKPN
jgi:hypothetical protein